MSNNEHRTPGSTVTLQQARDTEDKLRLALQVLHPNARIEAAWSTTDERAFVMFVAYVAEVSLEQLAPLDARGTVALIEKLIPIASTDCKNGQAILAAMAPKLLRLCVEALEMDDDVCNDAFLDCGIRDRMAALVKSYRSEA